MSTKQIHSLLVIALALLISACQFNGDSWKTKDISGLMPDLRFHLHEVNRDRMVDANDYRGKVLLVYFGYTQCPDVCSTTMIRFANALLALGDEAKDVRFLFVSVDPKRDTQAVLKQYIRSFGKQVIGLRGGQVALSELTKRYRVTYGYGKPDSQGNYTVSHSSAVYVFDRRGEARLLIRSNDPLSAIVSDIRTLLKEDEPSARHSPRE